MSYELTSNIFSISLEFIEIKFEQKINFNRLPIKRLELL